ncbi:hypothetical protein DFH07DRAFT_737543 [Mycena maculata]|uniref:FAD-binding PCMH-type domain-containing protein n=1 Tax=Mycena maculata TaxID=230809 RepID=A0AAD7JJ28_9AGAR|nr:hypothetical protein DFH07DRAFT_737543 [Mycena maculata]
MRFPSFQVRILPVWCVHTLYSKLLFLSHSSGSLGYKDSIRHFLASSSEVSQIAVQPGSVKDLSQIMRVLSRHPTVRFAVKGGGHGMAPGLSSTTEIHISMTHFSKIYYNAQTELVEIGSGCLWEQVYTKLAPTGRNIVGGASADGVGVGGWLLGGGYSLKSNRHGLGIDNVVEIEIVTPDGCLRTVNRDNNQADLFHALRGGGNNFGIVTKFVLKTFAQNTAYGSYFVISGGRQEEFKNALVDFVDTEERQEACVVAAFRHELVKGKVDYTISIYCVFDAEKPKKKRNIPFQGLARLQESGESWKADPAGWQLGRTSLSISDGSLKHESGCANKHASRLGTPQLQKNGSPQQHRDGRFACLMISRYTKPLLDKMAEEAEKAASHLKTHRGLSVIIDAWPVHPGIFDNSPPGAAFPHKRGEPSGPMLAYFRWERDVDDEFWLTELKDTLDRIRVVARDLGLTPRKPAYYNNLSLETVPAHKIYRDNMGWLKRVKKDYDPTDVMGRCGGHKIPLPHAKDGSDDDSD